MRANGIFHRGAVVAVVLAIAVAGLLAPRLPVSAAPATTIDVGTMFACALTEGSGVKCWGYNNHGQLGNGSVWGSPTPVDVVGLSSGVAAIAAGYLHACALTVAGGVKCWGYNYSGQLGDGTTWDNSVPVDVVGLSSGVVAISAGRDDTCALTELGAVKCWGRNTYGQLGDGTTADSSTPVSVIGLAGGAVAVSVGAYTTCAITSKGGAKCWGNNNNGQLGNGTTDPSPTPVAVSGLTSGVAAISAGASFACALTTSGGVKCWGFNADGQLGNGTTTTSTTPVDVSGLTAGVARVWAGYLFACAVTIGGGAKCWGYNSDGQLGNGTRTNSSTPVDVEGLDAGVATIVAGEEWDACAVTTMGAAKCWGDGSGGQLGGGSNARRLTPGQVSGLFPGEVARPDGLISKGTGFQGDDVYNTTATGQSVSSKVGAGKAAIFRVQIQNEGDALDAIRIAGEVPADGFSIAVTVSGTSVKRAYLEGTLEIPLAPTAAQTLVIKITPLASTASGKVERQTVRLISTNDITGVDAVRAKVTVR